MAKDSNTEINRELLEACRAALRTLVICRDDLAASGYSGEGERSNDICEEAKALTPAIRQLKTAITKAEKAIRT